MVEDAYKNVSETIKVVLEDCLDIDDDYHKVHERRFARTLQVFMDLQPQGRVLELGCSSVLPLSLLQMAPDLEIHVTEFDLSKPLEHKLKIQSNTKSTEVQAYSLDLEKNQLPVPDEFFDYVLCCEVLEHMEVDPMFMLSEVNRVLKPNGTLILTTPNAVSSWAVTKVLQGYEPYFYMQYHKDGSGYHRHNYEYSIHSLKGVLVAAGFEGEIWTENTFENPAVPVIKKLLEAGFLLHNLGDNLFAVAKKTGPILNRYPEVIYV